MELGLQIKKVNDLLEKQANRSLQEMDLTFSQHHVLVHLLFSENHTARLKELEKYFRVAQATMAGIVVRLESKGLVVSGIDPDDRRIKVVTLTDKGEEACRESREKFKQIGELILSRLEPEEAQELGRLLDIVYTVLKEDEGEKEENKQL